MTEADSYSSLDSVVSLKNLPDDCLFIIFLKLDNYEDRNAFGLTCHRWLQIQNLARRSLTYQLHHRPNKDAENLYVKHLSRLLSRFPNLSAISLANCTELSAMALCQLRDSGSTLRSLSLYCCLAITDDALSVVATGCPNLSTITLYRCNITDVGLEALVESCSGLESVNLSHCASITDRGIGALSRCCNRICALMISNCKCIKGTGFDGCSPTLTYLEADSCRLSPEGMPGIISGGGLEYLNLSNLYCLGSDGLVGIGTGLAARLKYLNLRMCRFIGDRSVEAIAKGCPALEEWSLAVCHEVRIAGWKAIGLNCKSLKVLHVNRCRNLCDRGLQALREGCCKLKVIYMNRCGRVTFHGLETFKMLRNSVEMRREERVSVGPCLDNFFVY